VPTAGNASFYNSLANRNLEWETTQQANVGLDFGLWNNKVTLVVDYYNRKTDNLILSVPTPGSFGFNAGGVLANVGQMRNYGVDIQAGYNKTNGNLTWNLLANVGIIKNKVLALNTETAAIEAGADQDLAASRSATANPLARGPRFRREPPYTPPAFPTFPLLRRTAE